MSLILALNLVLMAAVLIGIVGVHHWAIRTQHHDWPEAQTLSRRAGHDRRHTNRHAAPAPERRRGERRAAAPMGAR